MPTLYSWINDLVGSYKKKDPAVVREQNLARARKKYNRVSRFIRILGPGIVTGAADDDPSGIATYSQSGAIYGTRLLWLFPIMFPLLLAVQESCARIGAVTGDGLAAILKKHYNKKLLIGAVLLAVVANVVNIGADLGAMAASTQLIFPEAQYISLAIIFALVCVLMQVFVPYKYYAKILKWLAIVLFAYPITALLVGQDWGYVIMQTFTPHLEFNSQTIYIIVGILGTTISPYLFFWNTSEVVEGMVETKRIGISSGTGTPVISKRFIRKVRIDTIAGMSLAIVSAWFIVIACASVLNAHGITEINNAQDAAAALEPLVHGFPHSGLIAKILFSVGIIGTGLLAVPVLAGSSSYALSEAFGIREGLYRKLGKARGFYGIIALATLAGLGINFIGIDPIQALVFTAVFNAVAAVPLLWMILRIGNNEKIMGVYKNSHWSNIGIITAFILMSAGVIVLLVSLLAGWQ